MDNKEMEKKDLELEDLDKVAGGWTMGYDPRIMDCPHCGHHMLKRTGKDKEFVFAYPFQHVVSAVRAIHNPGIVAHRIAPGNLIHVFRVQIFLFHFLVLHCIALL